jgi:hypothetical protein
MPVLKGFLGTTHHQSGRILDLVPGTGFEPARLRATPSRWCVYQFHHPGKDGYFNITYYERNEKMEARAGIEPASTALQAAA